MRGRQWTLPAAALGLALAVAAIWVWHQKAESVTTSSTVNRSCPTAPAPARSAGGSGPRVILVVEENHSLSQIIGPHKAPFLTGLAYHGTLLTKYVAAAHPSLPNYIRLLSGDAQGVTSDGELRSLAACNLVDQLEQQGISWKAYMEGQPRPCWKDAGVGNYVKRHNPFMYFDSIRDSPQRCAKVVPFDEFSQDLAAGRLPQFVFITPDLTHDMHGADKKDDRYWPAFLSRNRGLIAAGDRWLKTRVYNPLVGSSAWRDDTRLVVTFDEASRFAITQSGLDTRVATVITGPRVPADQRDGARYDHYALLRSIETLFGLPYLERAADAATPTIPVLTR
jgi:hypothetical protein